MSAHWFSNWNAWSALWIGSLWRASWQGGLFILGIAAVCRLLPRLPVAIRCWLWWLACLKLLCGLAGVAPLALTLLPAPNTAAVLPPAPWPTRAPLALPVEPQAEPPARAAAPHLMPAFFQPAAPPPRPPIPPSPRHPLAPSRRPPRLPAALLAIWLIGFAGRLAGTGRQWRGGRRPARGARPLEEAAVREEAAALAAALGLHHSPPLREADAAPGPLVLGFLRPVILLPPALAARLSREELRLALAHELAHVARGDLWLSLVPALAQSLFFFHPLAGLACREWATAREAACDAAALAVTGAPAPTYGRLLLKLAAAGRGAGIAAALGASLRADTLRRRIALLRTHPCPSRRRLRASFVILAAAGILGLIPWRLTAADPAPRERAVLAGVPGLEKLVSYSEPKIPLGELVRKVAADTGVPLTAAPDVADEPVTVAVNDYPARELLQQLADLLDYQWGRRSGVQDRRKTSTSTSTSTNLNARTPERLNARTPVYEIYQDLASKLREEKLRQAALAGIERRFRDELARAVAMAAQPPEAIDRILDEQVWLAEKFGERTPEEKQAYQQSPDRNTLEEQEREQWASAAQRVASPIPRALALLIGRLSEAQWARLWASRRLVFSTDPQPGGALRLPEETARLFRASRPATFARLVWLPFQDLDDNAQFLNRAAAMQERWASATGYQVTIRLRADRFDMNSPIGLTAEAVPLHRGTSNADAGFWGVSNAFSLSVSPGLNNVPEEQNTPERKARLEKDPVVGVKKPFRPQAKPHVDALGPNSGTMYAWRELLPGLARTYGVQIISDAYWKSSTLIGSEQAGASEPTPLFALLDRRSPIQLWDRRGNLIRLRSRTWFFERPREIPLRLVRRWQALVEQKGALPLEEYAAIATTLTDPQRDGLFDVAWQTGLPEDLKTLQWDPFALRLYAALTPAQRQALWRGAAIPVARMTPASQELFQEALEMVQTRGTVWSPEELAAARLSMTARPMLRIVAARGGASTERLEPAPASTRAVSAGAPGAEKEKRYPVLQISFQFQAGAAKPAVRPLTVAMPDRP